MGWSPRQRDLAVSIGVLVFFVVVLVWTYRFPEARGREFPALVSVAAIVLCLIDLLTHTDTPVGRRLAAVLAGSSSPPAGAMTRGVRREAVAILWIAGATAVMVLAGFLVGIPVYVFCYMVLHARRPARQGVIAALVTTGAIWLAFELLLSYQLYRGVLFGA
jgi:Tripartite tricarboxylate transporter TctB family